MGQIKKCFDLRKQVNNILIYVKVLDKRIRILGEDHLATIDAQNNLANSVS